MKRERMILDTKGIRLRMVLVGVICMFLLTGRNAQALEKSDIADKMVYMWAYDSSEAYDSEENPLFSAVGVLVTDGQTSQVITLYYEGWNEAALYVLKSFDESIQVKQNVLADLSYDNGITILSTGGYYGGFQTDEVVFASDLTVGQSLWCAGVVYSDSASSLLDYFEVEENQFAGFNENFLYFSNVIDVEASKYGGAVFTDTGKLCGIYSAYYDTGTESRLAVVMDIFSDFLGAEAVSAGSGTQGSDDSGGSSDDGSNTGSSSGAGSDTGSSDSSADSTDNSFLTSPLFISLFFGSLAILVISSITYFQSEMKRRERGESEFPEFDDLSIAAGAGKITGKGGYFDGRVLQAKDGALIFGRDASRCNMVYPAGTKGVSSFHCKVEMQNGRLYLTDLGSTYGTFLENGARIPANTPREIKTGDRFYLADPTNTFMVQ